VLGGFVGMAVLIVPHGVSGETNVLAMLMLVGASFSWAIGTFFSKRLTLPRDPLASTGAQMLVGGISLAIVGSLAGEWGLVQVDRFSANSVLALVYLVVFGSVIAYTAYTWVLQHASVSRVSTYAYVNPVVAIVLGAAILNESVDIWIIVGAVIIVIAVALVIRAEANRAPTEEIIEADAG
jgi:drug/metabolite transporter (DMT)-like permease